MSANKFSGGNLMEITNIDHPLFYFGFHVFEAKEDHEIIDIKTYSNLFNLISHARILRIPLGILRCIFSQEWLSKGSNIGWVMLARGALEIFVPGSRLYLLSADILATAYRYMSFDKESKQQLLPSRVSWVR